MYVISERTGTIRVKDVVIKPGANEVTDPAVLEKLIEKQYKGLYIQDSLAPPGQPPEPLPEPKKPQPWERFAGRDGHHYYMRPVATGVGIEQVGPFETEDERDAALEEEKGLPTRAPLASEMQQGPRTGRLEPGDFAESLVCRGENCSRVFHASDARENHERVIHPELYRDRGDLSA